MTKTTHSYLAALVADHAVDLTKLPAGFTLGDGPTRAALSAAAQALVAQDLRIEQMTVALRLARAALIAFDHLNTDVVAVQRGRDALSLVNEALSQPPIRSEVTA